MGKSDKYAAAARDLAQEMGSRQWDLVYGGGSTGIMGIMASSVVEAGQKVTGIIPRALCQRERNGEVPVDKFGETILVDDMHTRKRLMASRASAFVSLPGGLGTLEEMFEVVRRRRLPTWSPLLTPVGNLESIGHPRRPSHPVQRRRLLRPPDSLHQACCARGVHRHHTAARTTGTALLRDRDPDQSRSS